ncbi:TetR/AcrR family transcriptional regulator, partial [Pseudomonas syringae pv. tagetis]
VPPIHLDMRHYINTVQLQYNLDNVSTAPVHLAALVLRGLAP